MKEFIKLDKYGQLYIDKVLFESYFPVIFTCVNYKKDIFIGVCCQNNEKGCKWLLGKTNGMSIVRMLRDEITIRQAEALGTINKGIEPIEDALVVFASAIGNISIPSEVVSTLKVFGELCTNLVINTEKYTDLEKYKSVYNSTFSVQSGDLSIKVESDDNNYANAA